MHNIVGVQAAAEMVEKVAAEGVWMGVEVEVAGTRCAIAEKKMPQVISRGEQVR